MRLKKIFLITSVMIFSRWYVQDGMFRLYQFKWSIVYIHQKIPDHLVISLIFSIVIFLFLLGTRSFRIYQSWLKYRVLSVSRSIASNVLCIVVEIFLLTHILFLHIYTVINLSFFFQDTILRYHTECVMVICVLITLLYIKWDTRLTNCQREKNKQQRFIKNLQKGHKIWNDTPVKL
jgi:hypothetical protein